jgi:excinuclease ABC subunit A
MKPNPAGPSIIIRDARKHNLRHLDLDLPKQRLVVITGVSGSGKSSLAYDTIFSAGQQRFWQSLSLTARRHLHLSQSPEVAAIDHLSPVLALEQSRSRYFHALTVSGLCGISSYLRLLYARTAVMHCPACGNVVSAHSRAEIESVLLNDYPGQLLRIFTPSPANLPAALDAYRRRGYTKAWSAGRLFDLDSDLPAGLATDPVYIQIDVVEARTANHLRLQESLALALNEGAGHVAVLPYGQRQVRRFSHNRYCPDCDRTYAEPGLALFSTFSPQGACPDCRGRGWLAQGIPCPACAGSGLNALARNLTLSGVALPTLEARAAGDLTSFFTSFSSNPDPVHTVLLPPILGRLDAMRTLHLDYLSLHRPVAALSQGEIQRCRLVAQLGQQMTGVLYVLDEPSIGLHPREIDGLLAILRRLRSGGNSLVVVEHDEAVLRQADWLVELGPGSGPDGGQVIAQGPAQQVLQHPGGSAAAFLTGAAARIPAKDSQPTQGPAITLENVHFRNLRIASVSFPTRALTTVCGVSGAGKSTLVMDVAHDLIRSACGAPVAATSSGGSAVATVPPGLERVLEVTQGVAGRHPRSCILTYLGLLPRLSELYAQLPVSRLKGYGPAHFSLAHPGGRCEACAGQGQKITSSDLLVDIVIPCPVCKGSRYQMDMQSITFKKTSLPDVFQRTAADALGLFGALPQLAKPLQLLVDNGLGYLKLGQGTATLSGGESQRLKLCRELARTGQRPTLFLIDEPTIGLHFHDVYRLLNVLFALVRRGHTVVVIEHHLDLIRAADHVIELGPGGGQHGGRLLYQGPPAGLVSIPDSPTAPYLKENL